MAHPFHPTDDLETGLDPADLLDEGGEPPHETSITGAAADAMRTGLSPLEPELEDIPGEDRALRAGDPDVDPLDNAFSGEMVPGGGMSTPDQNNVDDIGEIYGVSQSDQGELKLGDELLAPRDADRWELDPASKDVEE